MNEVNLFLYDLENISLYFHYFSLETAGIQLKILQFYDEIVCFTYFITWFCCHQV